MSRRAQSGIEYVVITGFALVILTPVIYLLITSLRSYEQETTSAQASAIARTIFATAEQVQHYGAPSRLTINARVPDGIESVVVRRNNATWMRKNGENPCTKCTEIMFTLKSGVEVVASTFVDVRNATGGTTDEHSVTTYGLDSSFFAPGVRNFQLEAFPDHVELKQT